MKKLVIFFILGILLINLVFAVSMTGSTAKDKEENQIGTNNNSDDKEQNQIGVNEEDNEDQNCEDYNYSLCPKTCLKKCVSSSSCPINDTSCVGTADCDGKGSCYEKEDNEQKGNLTKEEIKNIIKEKNRIKFEEKTGQNCTEGCKCTGVVMKCDLENGTRQITIYAQSGNIIIITKEINASTKVELYKSNGTLYGIFKNNETKKIIFPDQVDEKIQEKIKAKLENKNITLNEDGYYEVQGNKKARLFFLFPVREKINAQVNAENGEVIKIRNPWWGFLAKDDKSETILGASCGTVTPGMNDECCQNKGYTYWNSTTQECA